MTDRARELLARALPYVDAAQKGFGAPAERLLRDISAFLAQPAPSQETAFLSGACTYGEHNQCVLGSNIIEDCTCSCHGGPVVSANCGQACIPDDQT